MHTSKDIIDAVRLLVRVCNDEVIAGTLNKNGRRTGPGNRWTKEHVAALRRRNNIAAYDPEAKTAQGWVTLKAAAAQLGVAALTLRTAAERGEIAAEHPLRDGPWIFNRESLAAMCAIIAHGKRGKRGGKPLPGQLILGVSNT